MGDDFQILPPTFAVQFKCSGPAVGIPVTPVRCMFCNTSGQSAALPLFFTETFFTSVKVSLRNSTLPVPNVASNVAVYTPFNQLPGIAVVANQFQSVRGCSDTCLTRFPFLSNKLNS